MLQQTPFKVSVVIPCYNEEQQLPGCLEALAAQNLKAYEIIVVDNNSTDRTAQIAKSYGAKIVSEPKQGLIPARNAGFNAATGDIIAKLDADSRPAPQWLDEVNKIFQKSSIQAATGTGFFYDAPFKFFVRAYRNIFAVWVNRLALGHHMLWGSNLALRKTAWLEIAPDCHNMPNIMEDLDLAAHIVQKYGKRAIVYRASMRVDVSARRAMSTLKKNWLYLSMWPRTLALHKSKRRVILWPAIAILLVSMKLSHVINRFYNHDQGKIVFSKKQWKKASLYDRPNP